MTSGSREAIPPGIDISRPHSARMYDYFLGGKDNFAIDCQTAEAALLSLPTLRTGVRENRQFLAGRPDRVHSGRPAGTGQDPR